MLSLRNFSLDSCKLRIPLSEEIKIVDTNLGSTFIETNIESGEEFLDNQFKKNAIKVESNGRTTWYKLAKFVNFDNSSTDYLVILLNSKVLKEKYFQGITINNIFQVWNHIQSSGIVKIPIELFLKQSLLSDVDFKFDDREGFKDFKNLVRWCLANTHKTNRSNGATPFRKKKNRGVQWSNRESTAFKTAPYFKIYHKEIELNNNSFEFADKYLDEIDYTDVFRLEYTIKNQKHFRYALGDENFIPTLQNVLNLSQNQMYSMLQKTIRAHINPEPIRRSQKSTTPNKVMLANAICLLVNRLKMGMIEIENELTAGLDVKNIGRHKAFVRAIVEELATEKDFKLSIEDNNFSYGWMQQFFFNPIKEAQKGFKLIGKSAAMKGQNLLHNWKRENPVSDDGVFSSKMRKKSSNPISEKRPEIQLEFGDKFIQQNNIKKKGKK